MLVCRFKICFLMFSNVFYLYLSCCLHSCHAPTYGLFVGVLFPFLQVLSLRTCSTLPRNTNTFYLNVVSRKKLDLSQRCTHTNSRECYPTELADTFYYAQNRIFNKNKYIINIYHDGEDDILSYQSRSISDILIILI